MAITFNIIQPPANTGVGLKIDTSEMTNGANTVERQNVCLADPTTGANVANVVLGLQPAQGYQLVANAPIDSYKLSYAAAFSAVTPGTSATTDVLQIFGSATKTVRVTRLGFSLTTATTALYLDTVLSVRSAAPTAGTATTGTAVPYDSNAAAATAVTKFWTAAPTAGAAVGSIAAYRYLVGITGTPTTTASDKIYEFGRGPVQAVVLRGIAQGLVLTFSGATLANTTLMDCFVEWTEE
jgi:hypothetical protein